MVSIKKKHVTLIEILVVVAIIGILASLLLPSLGKARKKSKATVCSNQLKQLGTIFHMYADDNNGSMMLQNSTENGYYYSWVTHNSTIGSYINKNIGNASKDVDLLWCPNDPYAKVSTIKWHPSYGYARSNLAHQKINSVANPSETVLFTDSGHNQEDGYHAWLISPNSATQGIWGIRHEVGSNIAWVDGHVSFHRDTEVQFINADATLWDRD